jgi:FixJ family two-component response regulator
MRVAAAPASRMDAHKPLIAIVDDDASVCRAVERLVRSLGMEAETFGGGDAFLDRMRKLPSLRPDCVLVDLQMRGMTGLDLQQRLRGSGLAVIFITAHDEPQACARALAAGAVGFLPKPFNDDIFIRTLGAALASAS